MGVAALVCSCVFCVLDNNQTDFIRYYMFSFSPAVGNLHGEIILPTESECVLMKIVESEWKLN